jgi:hypothetical protein
VTPGFAFAPDADIAELDKHLPEAKESAGSRFHEASLGDIGIRSLTEAELPPKFQVLLRTNSKFSQSWERNRSDLNDTSLSGFEQSLATISAHNGFSAQEIVDLLVVFRNKWKGSWRGRSYYRATVAKALGNAARHRRDQRQGAFYQPEAETPNSAAQDASEGRGKSELLAKLNNAIIFGGRIRFGDIMRGGRYFTAFDDMGNEILLGTAREMNGFVQTQANIVEITGINLSIPSGRKAVYWYPVVELFIQIANSQPAKFEFGLEEEVRMYLARALDALTHNCPCNAARIDLHNPEELYNLNLSIRNGRRDKFLYRDNPNRDNANRANSNGSGADYPLWPRFICWSKDGRLCVHVATLLMFLGTPVGGDERRVTLDRLQLGLEMMRFTYVTQEGQSGRLRISYLWAISSPDFQLDPDCDPQPGLNPEEDPDAEQPAFQVGDYVQWKLRGSLRFSSPRPILGFSFDGQYALFDDKVQAPVSQLILIRRSQNQNQSAKGATS